MMIPSAIYDRLLVDLLLVGVLVRVVDAAVS
jgi:hypothetical protein